MNRRGFLGSILALGAAPAIVRADSLMRIVPLPLIAYYGLMPIDLIAQEALRMAHQKAIFISTINREYGALQKYGAGSAEA